MVKYEKRIKAGGLDLGESSIKKQAKKMDSEIIDLKILIEKLEKELLTVQ